MNRRLAEMDLEDDIDGEHRQGARRRGKKSGAARTVQDTVLRDIDWLHFHIYTPPGAEPMTFPRLSVQEFVYGFQHMVDQPDARLDRSVMWGRAEGHDGGCHAIFTGWLARTSRTIGSNGRTRTKCRNCVSNMPRNTRLRPKSRHRSLPQQRKSDIVAHFKTAPVRREVTTLGRNTFVRTVTETKSCNSRIPKRSAGGR